MKKGVSLSLAIIVLLCVAGWASYGQRRSPARAVWEYKSVVSYQTQPLFRGDETTNELGAQGWELVSAAATDSSGTTFIFKRAK